MKILVTGGLGFIGSNFILKVLNEDRKLVPINRFHSSDFKVNYSGIISEVNDFCALEMEGWDEYYVTPEDKPFYKFLKV